MDIAAYSMSVAQSSLKSNVSLAVAKLTMDTIKQNTQELAKLIEPGKGVNLDLYI